jgi:hypothetical protein
MATTRQSSLMLMERACAKAWLEVHPEGFETEAEFEQAVDDLALHIFHYLQGWQEED